MNDKNTEEKRNDGCEFELLTFTCPHCGGDRFEEFVITRQEIKWVSDPCDPDYDWFYDSDKNVGRIWDPHHTYSDRNFYRCHDCEAPLTDKDGNIFWGSKSLYEWLLRNRSGVMKYRPCRLLKFTCPNCGGHRLKELDTGRCSTCHVKGVFENGDILPICEFVDRYGDRSFQCCDCHYELENENGPVSEERQLVDWLLARCRKDDETEEDRHEQD